MVNWKLSGIVLFAIGFVGIVITLIVYAATGGTVPDNFGIIIDAGSSHTGISLYKWPGEKNRCTGLVEQVAHQSLQKAMANFSQSGHFGEYLLPAVKEVKNQIPGDRLHSATLYLGATAGMRLLNLSSPQLSEQLINSTRQFLEKESGLLVEKVGIIAGNEEGLFAWITTNYLAKRLVNREQAQDTTLGMLDMGGASEQIAYEVANKTNETIVESVKLYGANHNVRVASNMCFGADQARLRYIALLINGSSNNLTIEDACLPQGSNRSYSGKELAHNACLKLKSGSLVNEGSNYRFTGGSNPDKCFDAVKRVVDLEICRKMGFNVCPEERREDIPPETKLVAHSAYYYTANVLNLTDSSISKEDFYNQTRAICQMNSASAKALRGGNAKYGDFYCFQLNYIYHTLTIVYGIGENWENIEYKQKMMDSDLGWSLGYMINATNAIPAEAPTGPLFNKTLFVLLLILWLFFVVCGLVFVWKHLKDQRISNKDVYQQIRQL